MDWFRRQLFVEYGVRKELVTSTADLLVDLGLDSIDQMKLMLTIEEEFDLSILMSQEDDYDENRTVGDAIRYILRQLGSTGSLYSSHRQAALSSTELPGKEPL